MNDDSNSNLAYRDVMMKKSHINMIYKISKARQVRWNRTLDDILEHYFARAIDLELDAYHGT